jgi:hypothetical protein
MIATAYELDIDMWVRLGFFTVPREIYLFSLYDKLVERKLHVYLTVKRVDITNDSILHDNERLKEILLEDFERCALVATLPSPVLEALRNKKIKQQIQPF